MRNKRAVIKQIGWWVFFLICAVYALYSFYMGGVELLSLLNIGESGPHRAVPIVFVVHAFSGGLALLVGPLQFNRQILRSKRNFHRLLGKLYVVSIWLTSLGALWSSLFFDVTLLSKVGFAILAVLWFGTTTMAYQRIRQRHIKAHQEWMLRSFALSFFFVTFSFWVPGLASTSLPEAVSFPLAVFLSWGLNLLVVELWIRRGRQKRTMGLMREVAA